MGLTLPAHLRHLDRPQGTPRAPRFTGAYSQRKRKRLAELREGPEFLASLEGKFLTRWRSAGGPEPVRQYQFAPGRKFKADFAWPDARCLVEIDGGTWTVGGHSTGKGHERDREKSNLAAMLGWTMFRLTAAMAMDEERVGEIAGFVRGKLEGPFSK